MTRLEITYFTGYTPTDVYIADHYGNNRYYLGQLTGATPPTVYEYPPSLFDSAPQVMVIMSGANGYETFKIIDASL